MGGEMLIDFADITMGQSPPGDTVSSDGNGLPLLNGPTEFGPHHPTPVQFTTDPRKRASPGDLLFCVRGSTTGRMNWADQEYAIGRGVAAIRHRDVSELQPLVRALIEYELPYLLAQATGSTFPNVSASQLAALPYPRLGRDEQRAIAHIFGTLDDKIELNRRMNETLEGIAAAIFKSWFVDFDPVRAKTEGRDTGLPKHIADLFPDRFEGWELGEIPAGWKVNPIGNVVEVLGGGTPSTKNPKYWEGGKHPFCTPKDMSGLCSPVLLHTERHLTDIGVKKVSSGRLPSGTVLLSSRAPIGYLAIAETQVSINQGIIAMVCRGELPKFYVLFWVRENMDVIESNANGSTFQEISKKNFRPIQVVVPNKRVLDMFSRNVKPMYLSIVNNLNESRTLAALRDTLLPKLVSGELHVPEAEQMVKAAEP